MLPAGIPLAPVLPGQPSNRGASEESQQEPRELPSGAVSWEGSTRTQGNAAWRNWLTAPLNTCITRDEVLVLGRELAALLWGWIARGRVIFILGGAKPAPWGLPCPFDCLGQAAGLLQGELFPGRVRSDGVCFPSSRKALAQSRIRCGCVPTAGFSRSQAGWSERSAEGRLLVVKS